MKSTGDDGAPRPEVSRSGTWRRATRFSRTFEVGSASGLSYGVEIRDLRGRQFHCDCVDFRINGLGTCKHVEAVLLHLQARFRRLFNAAAKTGSNRIDLVPDTARDTLRLAPRRARCLAP